MEKLYEKYLNDRPSQPWTYFTSLDKPVHSSSNKRVKRKYTVSHNKRKGRIISHEERNTKKNRRR